MVPITQQHAEAVARGVVSSYERQQDRSDDFSDQRVSDGLWRATMESMHRVSSAIAADEVLLDVKPSYSYKASINVSVTVTLLVATDRRLWVARHDDGVAADPFDVAYESIRPVGKMLSLSVKVEQAPEGVVITGSKELAGWLQALQLQRPTQTAAWLTTGGAQGIPAQGAAPAQVPAGWHADPHRRYQLRYWDGARWTEHVSTNGVQAVDPVA